MTKEPRIYNGERLVSSINDAGKTGYPYANNETESLYHTQKSTIKGLNVRPENIKFLERSREKAL